MHILKTFKLATIGMIACCFIPLQGNSETKQLKAVKANEQVVVSESDPTFTDWLNQTFPSYIETSINTLYQTIDREFVRKGH